jgi:MerR family transcriptional regulator, light-induced transcriptional regulator
MSAQYSIKDLERLSGIKAHTLRIWEQRYHILKPQRTDTNIRFYSNMDLKRILNISLLNGNGFKISNIAKLADEEIVVHAEKYLNNYTKESDQVEHLILCMMDLNEDRFEKTINNSVLHFGFESTMENIVFPFLRQLGNMWQIGMITTAQEHYITNLIRQKIIVNIDRLSPNIIPPQKKYLFYLPSEELHEMGLLYTCFLAKLKGHKCIYLGQSVPIEDLILITKSARPHYVITILTAKIQGFDLNSYLHSLHEQLTEPNFLLSGRLMLDGSENYSLPSPKFLLFDDFLSFKKFI